MDYLAEYRRHERDLRRLHRRLRQDGPAGEGDLPPFQPSTLLRFWHKSAHRHAEAERMLRSYYAHQRRIHAAEGDKTMDGNHHHGQDAQDTEEEPVIKLRWCAQLDAVAAWRWFYFAADCRDPLGRPIGILNVAAYRKPQNDGERRLIHRYLLWQLEMAQAMMRPPHMQTVIVVNAVGAGWAHVDLELGRHLIDLLKTCYPDTVGRVLMLDMSWVLRRAWSMIGSVLPPEAHGRIVFLSSRDELWAHLPREQLEDELSGLAAFDARQYADEVMAAVRRRHVDPDPLLPLIKSHAGISASSSNKTASLLSGSTSARDGGEELELSGIQVTQSPYNVTAVNSESNSDSEGEGEGADQDGGSSSAAEDEQFWDCVESLSDAEQEAPSGGKSVVQRAWRAIIDKGPMAVLSESYQFVYTLLRRMLETSSSRWRVGGWLFVFVVAVYLVRRRRRHRRP